MDFTDKLDILYARRSSEDGKDGESIENQVALLKQYAADKGYYNIKVVTDDGLKLSIPLDTLTARILKLSSDSQSRIEPTPFYSWWEPADCRADSAVTPVAHKISPDHCF